MHHRNSTRDRSAGRAATEEADQSGTGTPRTCPWCGSDDTVHSPRGFVGTSNDRDQYLTCRRCGRVTWEIVSRTTRDMRMGQFQAGDIWRDHTQQTKYVITRVLRAGANETLLYVRPVLRPAPATDTRSGPP